MLSTMARNDLGRTIIDELRLCYVAEPTLLAGLSETNFGERINYDDFALYRVGSRNFQCAFDVVYGTDKVATLRFWHHVEQEMSSYVFYRIENRVLYDDEVLRKTLILPDILGMEFQHITSIDLARDFKFNAVQRIRKLAKDESIKVIVNGKAISKDKDVPEGMFVFPLNFKKLNSPTIVIKQSKAVRDKTKGLTLCGYNKGKEIETSSHKNYIIDFYGNPKSLHRLEIHQNNDEIKDFCKNNAITQDISLIFNQEFLDGMYNAHLSSLLRFTRGRTRLVWSEILQ
jgi:tRNA-binding EMAP/Myf-like protein